MLQLRPLLFTAVVNSQKLLLSLAIGAMTLLLVSCDGAAVGPGSGDGGQNGTESSGDNAGSAVSSLASQSSSSDGSASSPLADCKAPVGLAITDIDSVTAWINAMPKPLSLACFVKTLPRPMYYNATLSSFSAQPSVGQRSPRVFLFIGDLILTVVPDETTDLVDDPILGEQVRVWDADDKQLLELSLEVESDFTHRQSIKAEIAFPVTETLPASAPYAHLFFNGDITITNCAFCHADEVQVDAIDGIPIYRSQMLRNERHSEVSLAYMLNQHLYCDPDGDESAAYRCNMLEAIYGQGPLVWRSFKGDIPTIFDN